MNDEVDPLDEALDSIVNTLDPVSDGAIDRAELRIVVEAHPESNCELEALRVAQWVEAKNDRLTRPVPFFERWLETNKARIDERRKAAKQKPSPAPRDYRNAPPEQREAWMRSNVQDFVERTVFLQESFGKWERERHEATGEYADRLHPERRAKIRGEIVARRLIGGNRWTVGIPEDVEWETAEYEQKERQRLGLELMDEATLRRRFRHLGKIGPKDREYTLLLPARPGTLRDDTNLNQVKAIARHPEHSQQREVAREALRKAGESW